MKTFMRICSFPVLCAAMAVSKSGCAYTLWTEDAESGTGNVLTNVSSYPRIQSQIVHEIWKHKHTPGERWERERCHS